MPLTALAIKNLKPKEALYLVSDGDGLHLAVSPAGGKLWRYRYRYNGKQQVASLGKWPTVTLEQARKLRDDAKTKLAEGKHLTREKKAEKLRRSVEGENTFEFVARNWMAHKAQKLNAKYAKQTLARLEEHVFPHIGALPVTDITIPEVVKVIEKIGERGIVETAHRMKQCISQIFRYATQRGLCQYNPAADMRDVLPSAPDNHHACIKPEELPDLLNAMADYKGDDMTRRAMYLLALTFVRTGELIAARWEEIDFEKAVWHIPAERMKMRRPHVVPLSKQALALLHEQHKETGHRDFVFFNAASKSKHMSNGAFLMALRRMGYSGRMTGHGFRALASTILNEHEYNPDVIERQLAHVSDDKIRSAYNRAEYLPERIKLMQDYANLLDYARNNALGKIYNLTPKKASKK